MEHAIDVDAQNRNFYTARKGPMFGKLKPS
jgi:hypothetical protein